ncbi:hypothetical protein MRX96_058282 [Rhipicephalus microplus]
MGIASTSLAAQTEQQNCWNHREQSRRFIWGASANQSHAPSTLTTTHNACALNRMGIASTWLPDHTDQQNCCAMRLGTTLHTMFQRRQKPCHFNSHPDTHPLNKISIAYILLPTLTEQ